MTYNGRECEIRVVGAQAINGLYAFCVEIVEGEVIDRHSESIPLARLRARAEENGTTVAQERDNAVAEALERAKERFKDIVDVEA